MRSDEYFYIFGESHTVSDTRYCIEFLIQLCNFIFQQLFCQLRSEYILHTLYHVCATCLWSSYHANQNI